MLWRRIARQVVHHVLEVPANPGDWLRQYARKARFGAHWRLGEAQIEEVAADKGDRDDDTLTECQQFPLGPVILEPSSPRRALDR